MAVTAAVLTMGLPLLLLLAASAPVRADASTAAVEDGSCLLAKKKVVGKLEHRIGSALLSVSAESHRGWRTQHRALHQALNASEGSLEAYIQEQADSENACSARLAEAKRALDGLLHDVNSLSAQVEAHEEVLETEAQNLQISKDSIDAVEAAHAEEIAACEAQRAEAKADVERYTAELEELRQIADPEVRYEHVAHETPAPPALTQELSKESCLQFKGFMQQHPGRARRQPRKALSLVTAGVPRAAKQEPIINDTLDEPPLEDDLPLLDGDQPSEAAEELSCDEQREELQTVFTETWSLVKELKEDALKRYEDETCFEEAEAKKAANLVPQVAAREQAAGRIETSEAALAQLEPILELVKNQVEELERHISEVLTPECAEVAQLSETLKDVRELILSLERCPGRNDFVLEIPEEAPAEETASAEPALSEDLIMDMQ